MYHLHAHVCNFEAFLCHRTAFQYHVCAFAHTCYAFIAILQRLYNHSTRLCIILKRVCTTLIVYARQFPTFIYQYGVLVRHLVAHVYPLGAFIHQRETSYIIYASFCDMLMRIHVIMKRYYTLSTRYCIVLARICSMFIHSNASLARSCTVW